MAIADAPQPDFQTDHDVFPFPVTRQANAKDNTPFKK
jgi:hypothetical protein